MATNLPWSTSEPSDKYYKEIEKLETEDGWEPETEEEKQKREIQAAREFNLSKTLRYQNENLIIKLRWLIALFILLIIPITILVFNYFYTTISLSIGIKMVIWIFIGIVLIFIISDVINLSSIRNNIEKTEARIEDLTIFRKVKQPVEYFNKLIQINVSNLDDYYAMVKRHTSLSFTFSLLVGLLGFALIVVGLIMGFGAENSDKVISYISTGSGVLIEFIAGVFFYLYNRTVLQLKDYHEKLIEIQNILVANQLISTVKADDQFAIITKMIDGLFKLKESQEKPQEKPQEEPDEKS